MEPTTRNLVSAVWAVMLALAILVSGPSVSGAEGIVYTKDNTPVAPKLEDLPLKESVSQYGVTWTFEKPARVGQFVNGDYYVVGPVTVIAPKPQTGAEVAMDELDTREKAKIPEADRVRNGSMLNPPARQEMAYDSGIENFFRRNLLTPPPVKMNPKDSLVSTISLKVGEKPSLPYRAGGARSKGDSSPLRVAAVLTCVSEPQPPDAFRPGFCDRTGKVYLARNLKREMLKSLPRPPDAPKLETFVRVFQRPWVNTGFFGDDHPKENMPEYGQWVGQAVGNAGLLLCSDYTPAEKEALLVNMVQVGIDYWGAVKSGHPGWQAWGGHGSGRKLPIVLAGVLLGDDEMATPTKSFPKVNFAEDNQTGYGECWTGAKVVFLGHSGIQADGKVNRPQWGPYEHLTPDHWQEEPLNGGQSEAYRRCCTSNCFVGQALTLRLLKLEKQWNHDAFFDYVDRWMTEDDKPARAAINKARPGKPMTSEEPGKEWAHEGATNEAWVKEMWNKYRSLSPAPTDSWRTLKQNPPGVVVPSAGKVGEAAKPEAGKAEGDKAQDK